MRIDRKKSRLRVSHHSEDINPMDGMANLADVMLVFACGLIIALIAAWNVDVSTVANTPYEVESIQEQQQEENPLEDTENLQDMGRVYKDPETGKMYIIDGE